MKGYDLRDSLPAGRPKPLTKQLSQGGESPAMPRKNVSAIMNQNVVIIRLRCINLAKCLKWKFTVFVLTMTAVK